mgnify:CR=1 FL=1
MDNHLSRHDVAAVLNSANVKHVAIANPKLAPYGEAAYQTLKSLGLEKSVEGKTVLGDNIGKTYQFVKTGNAEAGFIALSQCFKDGKFVSGSGYVIPQDLYSEIKQDAVLLKKGENNEGAKRFLKFLKESQEATAIRDAYGYGTARSRAELTERYCDLQRKTVLPQLKKGLSALVYTQLTDVEDEVNGLFTYDRTAIKPDAAAVRAVNEALEAEFEKAVKA